MSHWFFQQAPLFVTGMHCWWMNLSFVPFNLLFWEALSLKIKRIWSEEENAVGVLERVVRVGLCKILCVYGHLKITHFEKSLSLQIIISYNTAQPLFPLCPLLSPLSSLSYRSKVLLLPLQKKADIGEMASHIGVYFIVIGWSIIFL